MKPPAEPQEEDMIQTGPPAQSSSYRYPKRHLLPVTSLALLGQLPACSFLPCAGITQGHISPRSSGASSAISTITFHRWDPASARGCRRSGKVGWKNEGTRERGRQWPKGRQNPLQLPSV